MQVITTKYLGPTKHKGTRIKATTANGGASITISRNTADCIEDSHRQAVMLLCRKLDWHGEIVEGSTPTGHVYVFTSGLKIRV